MLPSTLTTYLLGSEPGSPFWASTHALKYGSSQRLSRVQANTTQRTRHQVNYPETYDAIFSRLKQELSHAASSGQPFKHLILLLGIPIAYPVSHVVLNSQTLANSTQRLTWLENIFASPLIAPIKLLNRRVGLGGSFFNSFDGSVDLLDDLDDHYTARTHKKERNWLVERLQGICAEFSVRLTILSGDVHLAALGRFYSHPRLNIPVEHDFRYIANVVSSAIVNKPPPAAVANLLSRRNKIHHLNHDTSETLLKLFDKDPGDSTKTASHNNVTMPSRNFAIITENSPNNAPPLDPDLPPPPALNGGASAPGAGTDYLAPPGSSAGQSHRTQHSHSHRGGSRPSSSSSSAASATTGGGAGGGGGSKGSLLHHRKDGRLPIHAGEVNCGTAHKAAQPDQHGRGSDGGLDVCICVEIDQRDPEGRTEGYGLTIPKLEYKGPRPPSRAGAWSVGSKVSRRSRSRGKVE